jgi:hypothetical protein
LNEPQNDPGILALAPAEASVKKPAVPFASFDHGPTVIQHDHIALDDPCAK